MPSNYNYTNLHMNVVFLTKRWTNSWQRVKECGKNTRIILLDCVNRDERKILWGEILQRRKGKEEKTQRTIKNYLFVTSRGYYYYKRRKKKRKERLEYFWQTFAIIYTAYVVAVVKYAFYWCTLPNGCTAKTKAGKIGLREIPCILSRDGTRCWQGGRTLW